MFAISLAGSYCNKYQLVESHREYCNHNEETREVSTGLKEGKVGEEERSKNKKCATSFIISHQEAGPLL